MTGVLSYVRSLIGWTVNDDQDNNTLKRSRDHSDDDPPNMKKYRIVKSQFPKIAVPSDDEDWVGPSRVGSESRIRYIPIRREEPGPSTSTPSVRIKIPPASNNTNATSKQAQAERLSQYLPGPSRQTTSVTHRPPASSNRMFFSKDDMQHFRPILKANDHRRSEVIPTENYFLKKSQERPSRLVGYRKQSTSINLDEDEDDDVYIIENGENSKGSEHYPVVYSNHSNDALEANEQIELSDSDDYDVIFVKKDKQPSSSSSDSIPNEYTQRGESSRVTNGISYRMASPSFKIFKSRNSDVGKYTQRNISPRNTYLSSGRFKRPHTISKNRLFNTQSPFWKSTNYGSGFTYKPTQRGNMSQMSEATRAAIAKSFRLDEKKDYEKLIQLSSCNFSAKNSPTIVTSDPLVEARALLKKLNFSEDGVAEETNRSHKLVNGKAEKEDEYDPITAASINLSDSELEVLTSADDTSTTSSIQITPVNSLHLSIKDRPLVKEDWLTKFHTKYENLKLEKKDRVEKYTHKIGIISKVNRDQWKSTIEKTVKDDMKLPISILEEALEVAVELPELTDEQQFIINGALRPSPAHQVLIEKFSLSIHRRDIQTLAGLNWLNDEVINFYMNLLMERSHQKKDVPKVYATNTFFYPKLMQSGHAGLKRWTRKVDIFSHDLMVVPVHLGVHWCMCIIDFRDKSIKYYDSMGGKNMDCCNALLQYLEEECMDKKKEKFDRSGWKLECLKKIPQQMNGSDCGMFSCTFAEFISRDAPINFSQNDMPYLRRKMIYEIVKGELLL